MKIQIVTPAAKGSRSGNSATATRWARLLKDLGHRVRVSQTLETSGADLLIALHAWRSAGAVARWRERWPGRPLVLALTGTDIYRFQYSHPDETYASMDRADRFIALHDRVAANLPEPYRGRVRVVHQSARAPAQPRQPLSRYFQLCVVGHLREEKDPLRAALAVRNLPRESRCRVVQVGRAHTPDWARAAEEEMAVNPRYRWRGEVAPARVRQLMARSHAMVISSIMEGGANVVSEACVAGLPVLASDIDGNIGLLGEDYPGYYPVQDSRALGALIRGAESEPGFLEALENHCRQRARLFTPEAEREGLRLLLAELA